MDDLRIHSLDKFLTAIETDSRDVLYRGVTDAAYELIPKIGRDKVLDSESVLQCEQAVFAEFKRAASPFLTPQPQNDLEWLFLCQHHGLPTRLLDWTTNPLVALYF